MKTKNLHNVTTPGFKTPKNYFESFDDELMHHLSKNKRLKDITEPGFKVPKDYFKTTETAIINNLKNEQKPVIALTAKKTWHYISGIAASLLLMLSVYISGINNKTLTVDVVETHLENSNLDSYELAELLSETNFLETDFTITEHLFSETNLEDYLLDYSDIESILQ